MIRGIAAISVTRITRKKISQKIDTSVCGLVSKPIGGGNSKTVIIRVATIAPTAPLFAEDDAFTLVSILDILSGITALHPRAQ